MEEGPPSSLSALSSKPAFLIVLGCITVNGISSFHIWKYITNAKRYTQVLVQHLVHGTILLSQKFQKCSPQFPDLYRLVDQNRFYRCAVECIIISSVTGWHRSPSVQDRKYLQEKLKVAFLSTLDIIPDD